MRASDMLRVHPLTDFSHQCSKCKEPVGIYPSGQAVMAKHKTVVLVCNRCADPTGATLAPGALEEGKESMWNPGKLTK